MDITNINCNKCPELVASRRRITWGYGNTKSKVIFIGEAPGRFGCDITGIPFTKDKSGELFQEMLHTVNWSKEEVYTTNIVKCCPPFNRTPTDIEITNCIQFLREEIINISPKLIVTLGLQAAIVFCPECNTILKHWDEINVRSNNLSLIMLPHPAFICRRQDFKDRYIKSFIKIKEIINEQI